MLLHKRVQKIFFQEIIADSVPVLSLHLYGIDEATLIVF